MYYYIIPNIFLLLYLILFRNKVGFVGKFFSIKGFENNSKIEKIFLAIFIFEIQILKLLTNILPSDFVCILTGVAIGGVNTGILKTLKDIEQAKNKNNA